MLIARITLGSVGSANLLVEGQGECPFFSCHDLPTIAHFTLNTYIVFSDNQSINKASVSGPSIPAHLARFGMDLNSGRLLN